jgi:hypothetical protein
MHNGSEAQGEEPEKRPEEVLEDSAPVEEAVASDEVHAAASAKTATTTTTTTTTVGTAISAIKTEQVRSLSFTRPSYY